MALAAALSAPGAARSAPSSWPPAKGPGFFFAHFGEEHWDDDDGLTLLPKVVADTARYRPAFVTMSGDKTSDGTPEKLGRWLEIMKAYDRAGVPYFAGVGNHDGKQRTPEAITEVAAGSTPLRDITNYRRVFAVRPYPMGDAPPYRRSKLSPTRRPAADPEGAASHYYFDYGNVRYVFLDSSCYGIRNCDPFQANPFPDVYGASGQFDFLERVANEARRQGKHVFLDTHMPTRDPRDQSHSTPIQRNHVMGKGISPDNLLLENAASRLGVAGVFMAHIKGQWRYRAEGVPYYIDGGAGGELYSTGPVGVDHGYWHGYRLVRVNGRSISTDTVPIFVPGSLRVSGPRTVGRGRAAQFSATGKQPVYKHERKVDAMELRDPDPQPRGGMAATGTLRHGLWLLPLAALGLLAALAGRLRVPRKLALGAAVALLPAGLAAAAIAQQSIPDDTPRESLNNPARIWTTANRFVLAPVASGSDDRRRDRDTQTQDGVFRGRCPGRTKVRITSGHAVKTSGTVRVPSARGRIVRRVRLRKRRIRPGRRRTVARIRLAQPAEVIVRVRRGRRLIRTLRHACLAPGSKPLRVTWDGRSRRRGKLRRVRARRYRVRVVIRSDRKSFRRSTLVRVLKPRRRR